MFERFTLKARRVVFFGRFEATQCHSARLAADHLLLGLLRENRAIAARILPPGEDLETIRERVKRRQMEMKATPSSAEIPLGYDAKRVLEFAVEEAEAVSRAHVGTGHLFLGLLRVQDSLAAELLSEKGSDPAVVRAEFTGGDTPYFEETG